MLGRWGGEEFIAVLVETDARIARIVAERMRAAVAAIKSDALPEGVTISLGVATLFDIKDIPSAWDTLLTEADRHLYLAKKEGRNRVVTQS